jgi:hypothetical protein
VGYGLVHAVPPLSYAVSDKGVKVNALCILRSHQSGLCKCVCVCVCVCVCE